MTKQANVRVGGLLKAPILRTAKVRVGGLLKAPVLRGK